MIRKQLVDLVGASLTFLSCLPLQRLLDLALVHDRLLDRLSLHELRCLRRLRRLQLYEAWLFAPWMAS